MNIDDWGKNFEKKIKIFYLKDYDKIKSSLKKINFLTNGPTQIFKEINTFLKSKK